MTLEEKEVDEEKIMDLDKNEYFVGVQPISTPL